MKKEPSRKPISQKKKKQNEEDAIFMPLLARYVRTQASGKKDDFAAFWDDARAAWKGAKGWTEADSALVKGVPMRTGVSGRRSVSEGA